MVSHPENGSDSPIGSNRDRGRDNQYGGQIEGDEDERGVVLFKHGLG